MHKSVLKLYTQLPATCFGQPCDHLQGGKTQRRLNYRIIRASPQTYKITINARIVDDINLKEILSHRIC
jgi:hypothetical protein